MLGEIGQQLVTVIKAVRHVQRQIFLITIVMAIRGISIEVGHIAAVQRIHRANAFKILPKITLAFQDTFQSIGHLHIDIQYSSRSNGSLCHTRIVTHLDFGNILGLHLTQNQSRITIHRTVVDAEVIIRDDILITGNHQVGHQL